MTIISFKGNLFFDSEQFVFTQDEALSKPSKTSDELAPVLGDEFFKPKVKFVPTIVFIMGLNCNLRCVYCSESIASEHRFGDLAVYRSFFRECYKKYLSYAIKNNLPDSFNVVFTGGGEPTLNWDLFKQTVEMVSSESLPDFKPSFHLTTNGFIDDNEKLDFIINHFDTVSVSFDGAPRLQEQNRSFHGGNTTETVVKAIKYLSRKINFVGIKTTVLPNNFKDMQEMADYLFEYEKLKIQKWEINPVFPFGRGAFIHTYSRDLGTIFFKHLNHVKKYCEDRFGVFCVRSSILRAKPLPVYCGDYYCERSSLIVYPSGEIRFCMENKEQPPVGWATETGVMYNEKFNNPLVKRSFDSCDSVRCKKCIAFGICKGGCPAKEIASIKSGSEYKSFECQAIITMWTYILERIVEGKEAYGWTLRKNPDERRFIMERLKRNVICTDHEKMIEFDNHLIIRLKSGKTFELNGYPAAVYRSICESKLRFRDKEAVKTYIHSIFLSEMNQAKIDETNETVDVFLKTNLLVLKEVDYDEWCDASD